MFSKCIISSLICEQAQRQHRVPHGRHYLYVVTSAECVCAMLRFNIAKRSIKREVSDFSPSDFIIFTS